MSAVTSDISGPIKIGEGKDQKTIYTGTKITPTKDKDGNKTYKVEIVQYDNANGEGGEVIGEKTDGKIKYNNKASDDITGNAEAQKSINDVSKTQAKNLEKNKDLVTTSEDSRAFHKANGNPNQGTEAENEQNDPKLANVDDASKTLNAPGGAGQPKPGTRNSGFGSYVFPKSLREDKGQDFLKIDMMKYEPKKFSKDSFSFTERSHKEKDTNNRSIGSVILPIPGGIQDGQSVTWGESSMSPIDMAKANIALTGVTEGLGAAAAETGNMARNIASSFGDNQDALAAVIAGMAAGAGNMLTRTTGAIANPNMELLFGGPSLRTFSFQFQLAPRDKDEAMEAVKIIRFFKQGMAPIRTKSMLFMKSPHTFRLSYRNSKGKQHKYLNKFKECALGTFGVNYAPNGNYSTYTDGVPTAYQISMTYRELNPIYNDDYGNEKTFPEEVGF
tara:strand:- start:785 stop:2119 length:1335 start_codon:yes stop_codon:yes gene_type:complete